MTSPFALITGEVLVMESREEWRGEILPRPRERWADGGEASASARSPECQPTGDRLDLGLGLDLDSLLCDATPSTVSVMDEGFFPGAATPTSAPASLRTLDLKNVHFDLDCAVGDSELSAETMLKAKLERLERKGEFLARQKLSCPAQAEGRREDRDRQAATTTTPFALLTGDISALVVEPPTPPRLLDTRSALQQWLNEAALDVATDQGQSGDGGELAAAAAAAAWGYERAAAVRAAQAAGSDGERGARGELGCEEGGRRAASVSSEMSGRVEEHRNALAAGPKISPRSRPSPNPNPNPSPKPNPDPDSSPNPNPDPDPNANPNPNPNPTPNPNPNQVTPAALRCRRRAAAHAARAGKVPEHRGHVALPRPVRAARAARGRAAAGVFWGGAPAPRGHVELPGAGRALAARLPAGGSCSGAVEMLCRATHKRNCTVQDRFCVHACVCVCVFAGGSSRITNYARKISKNNIPDTSGMGWKERK